MTTPTWLVRTETANLTVWICVIHMTLIDQTQHTLVVGPRIDSELQLEQSARQIAEQFVELSSLFLVDDHGEVIARTQIQHIKYLDRPAKRRYTRKVFFNCLKTGWKKVDTVLCEC